MVNEALLAEKLAEIAAAAGRASEVLRALASFVRTAGDEALVRINPVHFAQQHGFATGAVVEMFLHARKLGLLTMEWQYVCPGCGEIVERLASLTSAAAHTFCQVCSVERDADLSDFIEVTFSVSPDDRLDYFGQTVNIAARVQALAGAGEIIFTDDIVVSQGAAERVTDLPIASSDVQLKGIAGDLRVHRIGGGDLT